MSELGAGSPWASRGGRKRDARGGVEVAEEAAAVPTNVLLPLPSSSPGTTRKAGGWRAGRETHPKLGLGLIFRKKGKETVRKGRPPEEV